MRAFHNACRGKAFPVVISHFADGDTVTVTAFCGECVRGHVIRVRVTDIESYELKSAEKSTAERYSQELTDRYKGTIGELSLSQVNSDRHGRAVGDILINGAFLSQVLVEAGYAWHVT